MKKPQYKCSVGLSPPVRWRFAAVEVVEVACLHVAAARSARGLRIVESRWATRGSELVDEACNERPREGQRLL